MTMSPWHLKKDLVMLILQFLNEEKYYETRHNLEQESGVFFNVKYFEDIFLAGNWEEVEKYLSGFTRYDENRHSMKLFFDITKQKYFEALDRRDRSEAVDILNNEFKKFAVFNPQVFEEVTQLIAVSNIREVPALSNYGNTTRARRRVLENIKKILRVHPQFQDKLVFPNVAPSRLMTIVNQSLNWQHGNCQFPVIKPEIHTLFYDHSSPSPSLPGAHSLQHGNSTFSVVSRPLCGPLSGRFHHGTYKVPSSNWSTDNLPTTVALTLSQGSAVTSMDFHPCNSTLLLVGTSIGDISLWDVRLRQRLVQKAFKIWNESTLSLEHQVNDDKQFSINRVKWSPDGFFLGVVYTKNLMQLYSYSGSNNVSQHMEVAAHDGGVNDLAFDYRNEELCVVTCGDDKLIKVWDLAGRNLYNFHGHEAPVYSISPHQDKDVQLIYSTSTDGKMKTWMYDDAGPRGDCNSPGMWCTKILFTHENRMLSCGTSIEGDSYLVEWSQWTEEEGLICEASIKRMYSGICKQSKGVVQFDTTQNHFLAVGVDNQIKFWHMDTNFVLTSTDAEGGLPSIPRLTFNNEGNLLAVSTVNDGFKILANSVGLKMFRVDEPTDSVFVKASRTLSLTNVTPANGRSTSGSIARATPSQNGANTKGRSFKRLKTVVEVTEKSTTWRLTQIQNPELCRIGILPDASTPSKIVRLLYASHGAAILAMGLNGIQQLWRWPRGRGQYSKASACVVPQLVSSSSGFVMANDMSGVNLAEAVPCIVLSKNDSYVMSSFRGRIKLFNIANLVVMTTFMELPPSPTYITLNPCDNNVIAIAMSDCTIRIFNCRVNEMRAILKCHKNQITSLVFSCLLNVLFSADKDGEICMHTIGKWEKEKSFNLPLAYGNVHVGGIQLQLHCNKKHLLVVHQTQLIIFDASTMQLLERLLPEGVLSAPISQAVYSSDSKLVYTAFYDGNIGVYDANSLKLRCRIAPSTYFPEAISKGIEGMHPAVIAANPHVQNQFAVGLVDGSVKVIEPFVPCCGWGTSPPIDDDEASSSFNINNNPPEQAQIR